MSVLHHVYIPCAWYSQKSDPRELELQMITSPCGSWKVYPGSLQEQQVLLALSHLFSPRSLTGDPSLNELGDGDLAPNRVLPLTLS